ncbi:uncharacterized protein GGS22DRAFT_156029 [Annulohypoxylon maeteangense]|uniref:uncharacterized protein n=1 Tax=Annulohypoxylon maeteangense TaxID=1927788 RepID=UPI002007585D|nr:uncharacterized protein GGS22DRAFT_156029 [Annulohypoxylon maeteangense]KAI0888499.1 hypothetical protein GGS22DRAFT_156029 [Annulohypoxylon maeteangense]
MPRKGSTKVRTGCLTCKIRKVKCDESKPHCHRCVSTGRKCDGYAPPPSSSALSWHRPRHLFPNVNDVGERRALQFFCQAAGPSLSGPMDPYFWTHLVMQFSTFEPAVRHSVVAISSLYEQICSKPNSVRLLTDNRLALCHYNSAIKELKSMNNEPLVLLVCILFVCIEFLLGNREPAIEHCKHGVVILENVEASYPWAKKYLSPIFRRLTLFPFFFATDPSCFPKLLGLNDQLPASFESLEQAQFYIDAITTRTVSLVRRGDRYRLEEMRDTPVSPELLEEQEKIQALLDRWHSLFLDLKDISSAASWSEETVCNVLLRYDISRIWVDTVFEYEEMIYDKYIDKFRLIVARAIELQSSKTPRSSDARSPPKFIFEMGFMPLLYYVVLRCRCLATRTHALSLMKTLGATRECLWDTCTMYAVGRRVIEIEHDFLFEEKGRPSTPPRYPGLPPDEVRVRDTTTSPIPTIQVDALGREIGGRMTGFFRRKRDGSIYLQTEFIVET